MTVPPVSVRQKTGLAEANITVRPQDPDMDDGEDPERGSSAFRMVFCTGNPQAASACTRSRRTASGQFPISPSLMTGRHRKNR